MAVVEEIGCQLSHSGLSREDPSPESSRAEGSLEVTRVVGRILLLVDWLEDSYWTFVRVAHDVGTGGTFVC